MSPVYASAVGYRHLRLVQDEGLRVLTLDRPPLNVANIDMLGEIARALTDIASDEAAAVLLITGAGKAFCAGVDVADHEADRVEEMIGVLHRTLGAIMALEIPVIAALNGATLGGGLELALACDVVLARSGAKLGQPEIQLGVFPPFAAAVLPRLIGRGAALDLCLTGRTLSAEDGRALGIVQHVFGPTNFETHAEEYARAMARLSAPVLRLTKRAIDDGLDESLDGAVEAAERLYLDDLMRLDDAHEGLAAFLEKRPPVWKGA